MMSFKQWREQFIEGFINLFYVLPSELRITVHDDDSIFLDDRLNFLDLLLMRKTTIVLRLFLIIKLNLYVILWMLMNNILLCFLMKTCWRFLGT